MTTKMMQINAKSTVLIENDLYENGTYQEGIEETDIVFTSIKEKVLKLDELFSPTISLSEFVRFHNDYLGTNLSSEEILKMLKKEVNIKTYSIPKSIIDKISKLNSIEEDAEEKIEIVAKRLLSNILIKAALIKDFKIVLNNLQSTGYLGKVLDESYLIKLRVDSEKSYGVKSSMECSFRHLGSKFFVKPISIKRKYIDNFSFNLGIDDSINYLDLLKSDKCHKFEIARAYLVDMYSILKAYEKNGDRIFDENLRLHITDYKIDDAISKSIIENEEDFQIYHNGISIICEDIVCGKNNLNITKGFVINGAQTIYNINKLYRLGILDDVELRKRHILAKIIKPIGSEQKIKEIIRDLRISTNQQKKIMIYDLKANDSNIAAIVEHLKKENIILNARRGEDSKAHAIDLYVLAKILFACFYQEPGKSRTNSYDFFFSDPIIFDDLFNISNSENKIVSIYLAVQIYFSWQNFKNQLDIETKRKQYIKYGEKYAIAFAYAKFVEIHSQYQEFKFSKINELVIRNVKEFFEKYVLVISGFDDVGTNSFKSDVNYNLILGSNKEISRKILSSFDRTESIVT